MMRKLTLLLLMSLGLLALVACGGGVTYVRVAPPPPQYGVLGVAPGPGYIWTEGYWDWRGGQWFWVRGTWLRPPRPGAVWVPGHWVEYNGRYRFVRGHWRR